MRLLVVLAHPDPASFNAAIAAQAVESLRGLGHEVLFSDLYASGFDAILGSAEIAEDAALPPAIDEHCRDLECAEGIVIAHPNWWGMPPAIMKGWIDRVFRPGRAYRFLEGDGGEGVPQALLPVTTAVVYNTGNTQADREREAFGDPLERLWRDCIFGLCANLEFHRRLFGVICTSSQEQRQAWLTQVAQDMARLFPRE